MQFWHPGEFLGFESSHCCMRLLMWRCWCERHTSQKVLHDRWARMRVPLFQDFFQASKLWKQLHVKLTSANPQSWFFEECSKLKIEHDRKWRNPSHFLVGSTLHPIPKFFQFLWSRIFYLKALMSILAELFIREYTINRSSFYTPALFDGFGPNGACRTECGCFWHHGSCSVPVSWGGALRIHQATYR